MHATEQQISALLRLQQLDLDVLRMKKQLEELPERNEIAAAREKRDAVVQKQEQVRALQAKAEEEVARIEDEDDFYAHKQADLQHDIDTAQGDYRKLEACTNELTTVAKKREKLEFELGPAVANLDKVRAVAAQIDDALSQLDEREQSATARFVEKGGALKASIEEKSAARDEAARELPDDIARLYAKTAARSGGVAVSVLSGTKCGACRAEISHERLIDVKRDAPLALCPHCRRLLVIM